MSGAMILLLITRTPLLIIWSLAPLSLCETSQTRRQAGYLLCGNKHRFWIQIDLRGNSWHIRSTGPYPWASDLAFLNLRILICKMRIRIVGVIWTRWDSTSKVLGTGPDRWVLWNVSCSNEKWAPKSLRPLPARKAHPTSTKEAQSHSAST